jgi:hypothetical protein
MLDGFFEAGTETQSQYNNPIIFIFFTNAGNKNPHDNMGVHRIIHLVRSLTYFTSPGVTAVALFPKLFRT